MDSATSDFIGCVSNSRPAETHLRLFSSLKTGHLARLYSQEMLSGARIGRWAEHWHCCIVVLLLIGSALLLLPMTAHSAPSAVAPPAVLEVEGKVELSRGNSGVWNPAQTNQLVHAGDWVRTGERSRAVVRLSDLSTLRLGEQTIIQIPSPSRKSAGFNFLK